MVCCAFVISKRLNAQTRKYFHSGMMSGHKCMLHCKKSIIDGSRVCPVVFRVLRMRLYTENMQHGTYSSKFNIFTCLYLFSETDCLFFVFENSLKLLQIFNYKMILTYHSKFNKTIIRFNIEIRYI